MKRRRLSRLSLALSYILLILLPIATGLAQPFWSHDGHTLLIMRTVLANAAQGRFNGHFQGVYNHTSFRHLLPGDILFCHDAGGGYGYYTHCALYVGDGMVAESYSFRAGTQLVPAESFHHYDRVVVRRVAVPLSVRLRAANFARLQANKGYSLFGGLQDTHSMYCSKLVWDAYRAERVYLCKESRWILPDDVARSSHLKPIPDEEADV